MKFFVSSIARALLLVSVLTAFQQTERSAHAQPATPAPSPSAKQTPDKNASSSSAKPQQGGTERERRAQAYAKMLEGQRYLSELRRAGTSEVLRLAKEAFQQAATLDPKLAEAHTALAEIAFYYPPQDFETATREGMSATQIDPNNFGAHHILARLHTIRSGLREGNLNRSFVEQAIKELKEVARLDTNNAEAWALLGEFYHMTGKTQEALDAWTKWAAAPASSEGRFFQYITNRELSPDAAAARLGEALLAAGRAPEALASIRRAIALNPENKEYGELLSQALETGGVDDKLAITELQRMVAVDPMNVSAIRRLARIQARTERLNDAVATLRRAITAFTNADAEQLLLYRDLAEIFASALRYNDAITIYEELLKSHGISDAPLTSTEDKELAANILQRIIALQKSAGHTNNALATGERLRRLLGEK